MHRIGGPRILKIAAVKELLQQNKLHTSSKSVKYLSDLQVMKVLANLSSFFLFFFLFFFFSFFFF